MTYLLDTSVLLEYSKRAENDRTYRIRQQIEQLDDTDEIALCGMVIAEFIQGMYPDEEARILPFLSRLPCISTADETFKHAGYLSRDLKNQGLETPLIDCLIAATAIAHDSVLVTTVRHFERFPDLKLLLLD